MNTHALCTARRFIILILSFLLLAIVVAIPIELCTPVEEVYFRIGGDGELEMVTVTKWDCRIEWIFIDVEGDTPEPPETMAERNQRVLDEMDSCVHTRTDSIYSACNIDDDSEDEPEECGYENTIEYRGWLTRDGPMEHGNLPPTIFGKTIDDDKIIIDVVRHEQDDVDDKNEQLAETVVHERLHRAPWDEQDRTEEEQVFDAAKEIIEELKDHDGSLDNCNIDWSLKNGGS